MSALACDLLVIGLGPAGGAACVAAAARGLRTIAVDRKRDVGRPVQCAEFVPAALRAHTTAPGVLVQPIDGMITRLPSGRSEDSELVGLMVDRARFDAAFAYAARAAGAELLQGTRLEALDLAASVARIRGPAGPGEIRFRVLVAGDGPQSPVARLLGLPPLRVIHTRQYVVELLQPERRTDIFLSERYPGGYAWLFPKGGMANLGVGYDERLGGDFKTPLDALHRRLAAEGRVGSAVLGRTGGAIPVGGLRERLAVGNVLFAGDAAGLTHPVSGAGIAAAVVSGERAAVAAAECLQGRFRALTDYEDDVRELFGSSSRRALQRRAELAAAWGSPQAGVDAVHRRGWIAFPEYYEH